jgi:hypothetical protein
MVHEFLDEVLPETDTPLPDTASTDEVADALRRRWAVHMRTMLGPSKAGAPPPAAPQPVRCSAVLLGTLT